MARLSSVASKSFVNERRGGEGGTIEVEREDYISRGKVEGFKVSEEGERGCKGTEEEEEEGWLEVEGGSSLENTRGEKVEFELRLASGKSS